MRILVTGATGLVGSRLTQALRDRGDTVFALSRRNEPGFLQGDPTKQGEWLETLDTCDAVVHLAGEGIFNRRWSKSFRDAIRDSRVNSTKLIAERLATSGKKSCCFISCSAIGIYGDRQDEELTEDSTFGTDFMAEVGKEWESDADAAKASSIRVVHPRLGIVLDPKGGALPKLTLPYKLFVGGKIGSGRQYVSWIHWSDLIRLLLFCIDTSTISGPINATAPNPVTNNELGRAIAKALGRPHWLPVPKLMLRIVLGGIASTLTGGQRVIPKRAIDARFEFQFRTIEEALSELLKRNE